MQEAAGQCLVQLNPCRANNLTWGQLIDNSAGKSFQIHCMMRLGTQTRTYGQQNWPGNNAFLPPQNNLEQPNMKHRNPAEVPKNAFHPILP